MPKPQKTKKHKKKINKQIKTTTTEKLFAGKYTLYA